ncbi:MAG: NAD(P)/FAD-dependent oxidoreductase [Oscillospiraceae bacterium]|nr:NAD(P)/FAD-dependent oxidoreductase [Oscillospiraceae bacterium]
MNYHTIIIGGGAAGMTLAALMSVNAPENRVLLISGTATPLRKLGITGKGRCNLTNNCDTDTVLKNIFSGANFMRSALTRFTPGDTMAFFEDELGVPLKTERGGRVFPQSDKAADVVQALGDACKADTVAQRATALIIDDGAIKGVKCGNHAYYAANVVIATGGVSYSATGSTGDGYKLAEQAGHRIIPPKPALVPLDTAEDCSELAGLSLRNVRLTHDKYSEQGEALFTHTGVSGPLVLTASCYIREFPAKLFIDLKPALDEKTLDARILRDFGQNKNRRFKNALGDLLPEKLIPVIVQRSGISPEKQVNAISREERGRLVALLKTFELTAVKTRPIEEAVITDGGVCVKEVNPRTMESKLVHGLYFAGEVLDIAAFTGGFNLQLAFSTAYAVAIALGQV